MKIYSFIASSYELFVKIALQVDGVVPIPCKIYGWMASLQLESLYLQLDCAKTPLSTTAQAPLGQSMSPGIFNHTW